MTFANGMTIDDYYIFIQDQMENDPKDKELEEDLAKLVYFANQLNQLIEKYNPSN